MTTKTQTKTQTIDETVNNDVTENVNQSLAVTQPQNLTVNTNSDFNLELAQLDAELEKQLRQLSVTEFVSPTSLLDSSEPLAMSPVFNLVDCFDFEIQEKDELKTIVIYLCDFGGETGLKTVAQSLSVQRDKWLKTFATARTAKIQLTLTDIRFRRLAKGGKAGNLPIVIELTRTSTVFKKPIN
jgi:hypothetical protein